MLTPGDSVGGHSDLVGRPCLRPDHSSLLRGIVARYRKTAIAALAVSALLLTPTAAYADHKHRGVSTSSEDRGMTWAYYSGRLTDYTDRRKRRHLQGRQASAVMIGMDGRSFFRLRVTGIEALRMGPTACICTREHVMPICRDLRTGQDLTTTSPPMTP